MPEYFDSILKSEYRDILPSDLKNNIEQVTFFICTENETVVSRGFPITFNYREDTPEGLKSSLEGVGRTFGNFIVKKRIEQNIGGDINIYLSTEKTQELWWALTASRFTAKAKPDNRQKIIIPDSDTIIAEMQDNY